VGGDGGAEGLAERNDHFAVDTFRVHEVFVGRFGIAVDASFVRFSFAAAITPVFQATLLTPVGGQQLLLLVV
jgi:hypothetical protein